MSQYELLKFIELIDARLGSAGVPYMLTGSVAMTFYAVPRMTRDVDLVVECDIASLDRLVDLFAADCYVDRSEVEMALRSRSMFNIIHNEWLVKADLIPRKTGEYRELEFVRRRRVMIGDQSAWVVSPEDLILSKLDWMKASGSELQQRDVAAMLRTVPDLDMPYLWQWAADLGVAEELDRAMKS
jgi:hypothetical protein